MNALAVGLKIALVRYSGMAAAAAASLTPKLTPSGGISSLTSFIATLVAFVVMGFVVLTYLANRRVSAQQSMLQTEREMLRALIDNIPDFMYVKDLQGRFVIANAHAARVMGAKNSEDLIGKTDFEFFPIEVATAFYEDERKVISSEQPLFN